MARPCRKPSRALDQGATVAYWRRDTARLLDDVAELAPTHLPSVPRVFEKIHAAATARAQQQPLERWLLRWAIAVGRRHQLAREADGSGFLLDLQHAIADRLVLSRIREAGELTPTAKVKRQAVYDKHRQRLDALYSAS